MASNRKRRGRGEGSISGPRKDGLWVITFSLGLVDGKRQRKSLYAKTKAEALELLRKGPGSGQNVSPSDATVKAYFTGWLEARGEGLAENTKRLYNQRLNTHIYPALGGNKLTSLTPQSIRLWLKDMKDKGHSEVSRAMSLRTLSAGLEQAVRDGVLQVNPVSRLDPAEKPSDRSDEMTVWSQADLQLFIASEGLAAREGGRMKSLFYPAFALGCFGGLRLGETLGLKWSDIDFKAGRYGIVRVDKQLVQVGKDVVGLGPLKTKVSRRGVALSPVLRGILIRLRERQLAMGRGGQEFVFMDEHHGHPSQDGMRRVFHRFCQIAGLPRIRFHDLRHTHATHLLDSGANPKAVAQRLGHSVVMLMTRYAHVLQGVDEQLAVDFDSVLGGKGGMDGAVKNVDGSPVSKV